MATQTGVRSPLHETVATTPTDYWNDSCSIEELTYAIENGAVGATSNPTIVGEVLHKEMHLWRDRLQAIRLAKLPRVHLHEYPGRDHMLVRRLRDSGQLHKIVEEATASAVAQPRPTAETRGATTTDH